MTADQKKPKSFARALQYNLAKVGNGVAEVLDHSFSEVSAKLIIREVQMMKTKRPDLEKFFYHTSINFPPHENLSNKLMKQIANDYLRQNGFNQHQFIVFRHYDAGHPHLHIIVNRIGFDEKVLSDSNDYARSEKVLRALEIKYKLTQVNSSKQSKRAVTKNELEMMKRTNEPSGKLKMQELIKEVLSSKQKLTSSEFIQALQKKGINVRFNQASTGYVSGISYSYKDMTITGSKLGSDFKWTTVRDKIDFDQERDAPVIARTNSNVATRNQDAQIGQCKESQRVDVLDKELNYSLGIKNPLLNDLIGKKSHPKDAFNSNLLEALIQVEVQPEMNSGILFTPKKKRRKKSRGI